MRCCNLEVLLKREVTKCRGKVFEADVRGFLLHGFWLCKSERVLAQGSGEAVTLESGSSSIPCLSLTRQGRGDQLPRGPKLLVTAFFYWQLAGEHGLIQDGVHGVSKVKLDTYIFEHKGYNDVIIAHQDRYNQYVQDLS